MLCLEKGYSLEDLQYQTNSENQNGEIGLNAKEFGMNLKLGRSSMNKFSVSTGKLTHDHLVLITNAKTYKKGLKLKTDSAKIVIDYIVMKKKHEQELVNAIQRKRERAMRY